MDPFSQPLQKHDLFPETFTAKSSWDSPRVNHGNICSFKTAVYILLFFSPSFWNCTWLNGRVVHANYHVCHIFFRLPQLVPRATRTVPCHPRRRFYRARYTHGYSWLVTGERERKKKNHFRLTFVRYGTCFGTYIITPFDRLYNI